MLELIVSYKCNLEYTVKYDPSCNSETIIYHGGYLDGFKVESETPTDEYEVIGNKAIDLEDYILEDMNAKADKDHLGEYYRGNLQLLGYKDKDGLYMVYGELW